MTLTTTCICQNEIRLARRTASRIADPTGQTHRSNDCTSRSCRRFENLIPAYVFPIDDARAARNAKPKRVGGRRGRSTVTFCRTTAGSGRISHVSYALKTRTRNIIHSAHTPYDTTTTASPRAQQYTRLKCHKSKAPRDLHVGFFSHLYA